ncbi:hypothetical protein [Thalassobacillus cyri]|uniref:hypothetical protein n=1 Tax=Thalassobacillus cyri TaxID=571932 RepID=UPI0015A0544D|nr:hypothetical protein [Thalassobacillus cyri]
MEALCKRRYHGYLLFLTSWIELEKVDSKQTFKARGVGERRDSCRMKMTGETPEDEV